jgi:4-hydroxybutyrate CoA-transferase
MVIKDAAVNWREQVADKLMSPREAMQAVKPGDAVWLGGLGTVPVTLCAALAERADELADVTIDTFLTPFNWDRPELLKAFRIRTGYAGPLERKAAQEGRFEFIPLAGFREGKMPTGYDREYDVGCIPISPPDEDGYCSFGSSVFFGPTIVAHSKLLIGEVHPEFIRTGGQNSVHISRFAHLAEFTGPAPAAPIAPRSEETVYAAEVICTLTATELVPDRSTVQIGLGDVSAALALYLTEKQDLGIHTELLPGGIVDLVDRGVVTGKYKEVHPGKVVASLAAQLSPEELVRINGNPVFELYDFNHTDDMRLLLQFEHFVAINNALFIDLTGNVCSETWGALPYTGSGGQPTFAYAAHVTNRHSIIVLPSSQLVNDERQPRIMATLPEGSTVTTHRGFVDYVVTEQGIAALSGKSIRERIGELISVAHPDFRADLRRQAAKIYNVTV